MSVSEPAPEYLKVADDVVPFRFTPRPDRAIKTHALILHDVGTKDQRKTWVEDFKEGKIDILFVYNMLLTGFDARRLKKLYLGRVIKAHNLLQALIRCFALRCHFHAKGVHVTGELQRFLAHQDSFHIRQDSFHSCQESFHFHIHQDSVHSAFHILLNHLYRNYHSMRLHQ